MKKLFHKMFTDGGASSSKETRQGEAKSKRAVDDRVPYSDLKLLSKDPIGGGSFGAVYEAVHTKWGCKVAYKKLGVHLINESSAREKQLIESLRNEAEIHRQQRHPNIAFMLGIVFEPLNYGIVMEYVTYGALDRFISSLATDSVEMSCVPWILKINLAHEISCGMTYLHSCSILHCDLKLQNILLGEYLSAKISDFGLSRWKAYSRTYTQLGNTGGTPSHTAPEKWADISYRDDEKCDVYSFSILLWEMFTEKKPFEENRDIVRGWVMGGGRLPLQHIPRDVPEKLHTLIEACWDQEADKRPAFLEIKQKLDSLLGGAMQEKLIKKSKKKKVPTATLR